MQLSNSDVSAVHFPNTYHILDGTNTISYRGIELGAWWYIQLVPSLKLL